MRQHLDNFCSNANTLDFLLQCNVYCMWPLKMFRKNAGEPGVCGGGGGGGRVGGGGGVGVGGGANPCDL